MAKRNQSKAGTKIKHRVNKLGQTEVSFNWLYVLVAGGVILLFFFGVVMKQKAVAQNQLTADVVNILESILTGAGVSEKTKNIVNTGGLVDFTLYFHCEDGLGEYGIEGQNARAQIPIEPVFSPLRLKTAQMITWSLPYKLPFKVIDFLFVTSANTKYYLLGESSDFSIEFMNATQGFNVQKISVSQYPQIDPGKNFQIRFISLDGGGWLSQTIPLKIVQMEDSAVSAVVFTGTNQVDYYTKNGRSWEKMNQNTVSIISLGGERDAAKYAAIFSGDDKNYLCNMHKAFARLEFVNQIYSSKADGLVSYYQSNPLASATGGCLGYLREASENLNGKLGTFKVQNQVCLRQIGSCPELISTAQQLANLNMAMSSGCLPLY